MKVLIVDDLKEIREFVKRILEKKGLQCDLAETGTEALKLAEANAYDLVLLDIQLPDIDGYTVCERYKKMSQSKDVPVLFLTVLDTADNAVKGLKAGAVDYIRKPFDRDELLARVMVHLELRKTRLALQSQVADNQQLVHILCHDLSNPMASTVSLLNMLQEAPEDTAELIPMVSQYLERGLELVDLIRDMVAIEENKFDLKLVPVYLLECLKESQSMLGIRFAEKKIDLNMVVDDSLMVMVEKASFISSVINNLLTNALKFSFPESKIDISATENQNTILLSIRDYGVGIPKPLMDKIFNLGAKTSRSGTQNEQGTGFGMPLVKRFVEAYGGGIELLSWDGEDKSIPKGTEVRLILKRP